MAASRPLSPHISIYRFAYTMATSILHRATGLAMSLSLVLFAAWFVALASGPVAYDAFTAFAGHVLVKVVVGLALAAFCYHLCNGVRHLFWDIGWGLERAQARRSAGIVVAVALVAAALLLWLFLGRGGAA